MTLDALCRALLARGYHVTAAANRDGETIVTFDFMSERRPSWNKAFSVRTELATPAAFEVQMRDWQARVLTDLALGKPSETVRTLIQLHGERAVMEAMGTVHADA